MKRKMNDNGMPPGKPNPATPGMDVAGAVRDAVADQAYQDRERAKRAGLNCFTTKAPWMTPGNDENG